VLTQTSPLAYALGIATVKLTAVVHL